MKVSTNNKIDLDVTKLIKEAQPAGEAPRWTEEDVGTPHQLEEGDKVREMGGRDGLAQAFKKIEDARVLVGEAFLSWKKLLQQNTYSDPVLQKLSAAYHSLGEVKDLMGRELM